MHKALRQRALSKLSPCAEQRNKLVEQRCLLKNTRVLRVTWFVMRVYYFLQLRDFHKELLLKIYPTTSPQGQVTFETV